MVDEGESETFRLAVGIGEELEIEGVRVDTIGDQIEHAIADALDHRRIDHTRIGLVCHCFRAARGDGLEGLVAVVDTDCETAGAGAVRGSKIGGERVRRFVDEEVAGALAVQGDRLAAMTGDGSEPHRLEQGVQRPRIRTRELDKLEAVDTERIRKAGRRDAGIRLRAHVRSWEGDRLAVSIRSI